MIGTTGETISNDIRRTFDVFDIEVEVGNHILPTGLTATQHRLSLEVLQGLVIAQRVDDRKQLLFMNRIASLGINHLLRHERDRLQSVAGILLKHCADCMLHAIMMAAKGQWSLRKV